MIRAVLDTNVLASGFVAFAQPEPAAPVRLLQHWQTGRFELVISADILTELLSTFSSRYFRRRLSSEQIEAARQLLQNEATIIVPATGLSGVATHAEDDRILAAAISADVDYLVTGDRELLRLGSYLDVRIVSPRLFLSRLERDAVMP